MFRAPFSGRRGGGKGRKDFSQLGLARERMRRRDWEKLGAFGHGRSVRSRFRSRKSAPAKAEEAFWKLVMETENGRVFARFRLICKSGIRNETVSEQF